MLGHNIYVRCLVLPLWQAARFMHHLLGVHSLLAVVLAPCSLLLAGTGAHEECERLERLIVRDFRSDAKGHAERLAQGHRVRKMLDQVQAQAEKLVRSTRLQWCLLSSPLPAQLALYLAGSGAPDGPAAPEYTSLGLPKRL